MNTPDSPAAAGGHPHPATTEQHIWNLFRSVFWPAAAGNVLWALINTVLFALSKGICAAMLPYGLILVVLGAYLSVEWSRNLTGEATMRGWRSFAAIDGAHLVLICAAAIIVTPTTLSPDCGRLSDASLILPWIMVVFYLFTAVGHAFNVWNFEDLRTQKDGVEKRRYKMCATANPVLGLVLSAGIAWARPPWQGVDAATTDARIAWGCLIVLMLTFAVSLYRHTYWQPDATKERIAGRKAAAADTQAARDKAAQEKAAQDDAAVKPVADAPPPPTAG